MKDAYTFDRDREGLDVAYDKHAVAYARMLDRCGLEWYRVAADVGMMGGHGADEYMAPCAAGENDVALAPGYAANVEVASADAQPVALPPGLGAPELVQTPGATTIDALVGSLGVPAGATLKAFPVIVDGDAMKMVVVRGDHRVNEIKLQNALGRPFRAARADEIEQRIGPPGYIGPVGAELPILLDAAVTANGAGSYVVGANEPDAHLRGVEPGRDFNYETVDVRTVVAGDTVGGSADPDRAGDRGGQHLQARDALLRSARRHLPGRERQVTAHLDGLLRLRPRPHRRRRGRAVRRRGGDLLAAHDRAFRRRARDAGQARVRGARPSQTPCTATFRPPGLDVLYDERDAGPGEKFTDAELLGCPLRLTVGRRTLGAGEIEVQVRRGRESRTVPVEGAAEAVAELWRELP